MGSLHLVYQQRMLSLTATPPQDVCYCKSVCIECPAKESTESSGKLGCTP